MPSTATRAQVSNILFILGAIVIVPSAGIPVEPALVRIDIPVMGAAALACVPIFLSGRRVTRAEGAALVVSYLAYLTYLVLSRG
ncbi:hypothetical protein [Aquamicrobium defluvii]|uniref:Sodium/calcium exchanger protein n=1 Tax=Aquamicrobium defluvii TaxID=69279 RepID=A0A011U5V7_9HYPH|nr:hypothetical protein [Aquamicrobium defluvii]EXL01481.1 hypothetical protein BG36_19250 [Aquamicrobium defluvii]EZQ13606.1 hypothetical protein CF98_27450 [Halopseudomonas bauzanensis]TDR30962.1 sodium/calcium exchanger protein [Aquamicrobium defluvii]